MKDIFISNISINNVRHLSDIHISLSDVTRKHLILTGKNGSGKTSVLEAIRNYMALGVEQNQFLQIESWKKNISNLEKNINQLENENTIENYKNNIIFDNINLIINDIQELINVYHSGDFLLTYFNAKRTEKIKIPKGIEKFETKEKYTQTENANQFFLQYLVNLKADRSFARDDNEMQTIQAIDDWFDNFQNWLKTIFDDDNLILKFDRKKYNFDIILTDNVKVNFNTLSDGYSALLNIVMELMMRMESKTAKAYDMQGIVLIDELETHLHIDLQKKVLPFLTGIFPRIQFIVTTHSPFVLNSIPNVVICDLEKNIVVEDLSAYPIDGIVEGYFNNDKYSQKIKNKIKRFEYLVTQTQQSEHEWEEMMELRSYLKSVPANLAPELAAEFQRIELQRLTVEQH